MPRHIAGTEIYTHTLAKMQQQQGNTVAVLVPFVTHYRANDFVPRYEYDGVAVYQFKETANPLNRDLYSGKKLPEGLDDFAAVLEALQPDVIHFHELNRSVGITAAHVKRASSVGAKIILTMHLSFLTCATNTLVRNNQLCDGLIRTVRCAACTLHTQNAIPYFLALPVAAGSSLLVSSGISNALPAGRFKTMLQLPLTVKRIKTELKLLEQYVHQFVSLTQWYRQVLLDNNLPPAKITVIPAGLALTTHTSDAVWSPAQPGQPLKLVFIGRMQPQKGVHLLIEAAKQFNSRQLQVFIYGRAEKDAYHAQCVAQSQQCTHVHWMGFVERETVVHTLSKYHLLCLPSLFSEMAPLVIQEAYAAGIPIIASKVYGNIEQVKDGVNGLLFDYNNAASLAQCISRLVNNPGLLPTLKTNLPMPASFKEVYDAYQRIYLT
jgi:glycosyltransferase involved in cell wall biosynthesis